MLVKNVSARPYTIDGKTIAPLQEMKIDPKFKPDIQDIIDLGELVVKIVEVVEKVKKP